MTMITQQFESNFVLETVFQSGAFIDRLSSNQFLSHRAKFGYCSVCVSATFFFISVNGLASFIKVCKVTIRNEKNVHYSIFELSTIFWKTVTAKIFNKNKKPE